MTKRSYGQFCGLVHAVDLVGERWALLIVRDLLVSPKRFTDLRRGLPRIPTNVLSARLKELESAGLVTRRVLPRPDGSVVYELTDYGKDLEDVVLAFGRWGARSLGEPAPDDIVTNDIMIMALRTTFQPEGAKGLHAGYELRMGDVLIHARVDDGKVEVAEGPLDRPDLVIESGPAIKALMADELSPADALASGSVKVTGDEKLLDRFVAAFQIGAKPEPEPSRS